MVSSTVSPVCEIENERISATAFEPTLMVPSEPLCVAMILPFGYRNLYSPTGEIILNSCGYDNPSNRVN